MLLPKPMMAATTMLLVFHLLCRVGMKLAEKIQKKLDASYPSIFLWLYPTIVLAELAVFSLSLIVVSNHFWGRGFWSNFLTLNGQETTRFFSSCFTSMLIFTSLHFAFAAASVLVWISSSSASRINSLNKIETNDEIKPENALSYAIEKIREETDFIQKQRKKATRINRIAMLAVFSFLIGGGCWIIFFRPAVVLYYRAELQLRTFIEPLAAYETLKHLSEKYPSYRYMDSVKYRMAWILDRRLNKDAEAAESYRQFLGTYSPISAWSDEAIGNLVRLCVDKLNRPAEAIELTNQYLQRYPDGILAPHMFLYRIRSFSLLNDLTSAKKVILEATRRFSGKKMLLINSEDLIVEQIDFEDGLKAEIAANANLQQNP